MANLVRFSVSLEETLLKKLIKIVKKLIKIRKGRKNGSVKKDG